MKYAIKLMGEMRWPANAITLITVHDDVGLQHVKFAKTVRFDMIMLGSIGRNAIANLLLGSVAQRVMAAADRPVLVVK